MTDYQRIRRALAVACATGALAFPASAQTHDHGLYDRSCCSPADSTTNTGDCHPIPDTAVRGVPGGLLVTLKPGDHPMVTVAHEFRVPWDDEFIQGQSVIRPSKDGKWAACLYPDENTLRCLYIAPGGS